MSTSGNHVAGGHRAVHGGDQLGVFSAHVSDHFIDLVHLDRNLPIRRDAIGQGGGSDGPGENIVCASGDHEVVSDGADANEHGQASGFQGKQARGHLLPKRHSSIHHQVHHEVVAGAGLFGVGGVDAKRRLNRKGAVRVTGGDAHRFAGGH